MPGGTELAVAAQAAQSGGSARIAWFATYQMIKVLSSARSDASEHLCATAGAVNVRICRIVRAPGPDLVRGAAGPSVRGICAQLVLRRPPDWSRSIDSTVGIGLQR